jgi:hypothetical protein
MSSRSYWDCKFIGRDPITRKFVVREELYPEARGWLEHEFDTEEDALAFLDSLPGRKAFQKE